MEELNFKQMDSQNEPSMNDVFLQKLREIILQNLSNEHFGIVDLVKKISLSRSQIHRKLKKINGKSITQFIREIRLEEALKLLKGEAGTAAEIAYKVGFNSPTYFNKCFHEYYGITPGEVGRKAIIKNVKNKRKEKKPFTSRKWKTATIISIVIVIIWASYYIISSTKKDLTDNSYFEKSIAVLPFINNTGDSSYDHWQYGISELLINALSMSEELTIIDNQTIFEVINRFEETQKASMAVDLSREVATRINVRSYITGNYLLAGSMFKINLKLVDTESKKVLKTEYAEGNIDSIFSLAGALSSALKNFLEIKIIDQQSDIDFIDAILTTSPEAYRYYIKCLEAFWGGYHGIYKAFNRAIEIDSGFTSAYFHISLINSFYGNFSEAKNTMLKAFEGKDKMPLKMQLWIEAFMTQYFEKNPYKSISYFKRVTEIEPLSRINWYWIGMFYNLVEDYDKALLSFKQIEKINKQLGNWKNPNFYLRYSFTYLKLKKYSKAQKILKKGSRLFPESIYFPYYQAVCALLQNDLVSANHFIKQYKIVLINDGRSPEPLIMTRIGNIYSAAGQIPKAVEIYRQAIEIRLKQGPAIDTILGGANNLYWYYTRLGEMLVVNDTNIEEGMEYINKARKLSKEITSDHDHPVILKAYGYGLFKQGDYEQALLILRKAEEGTTIDDRFHFGDPPKLTRLIAEVEEAIAGQQ